MQAPTRAVAALPDPCPFCGGRPVRKAPLLGSARIGVKVAGTGASLRTKGSGASYLRCDGCAREFVPAERDIGNILSGLEVDPRVLPLIRLYHGEGVTVTDLLTAYRTAIVRKVHRYRSLVSVSVAKREILICFRRRGVRTFGTFARRTGKQGSGDHYVFKGLGMA